MAKKISKKFIIVISVFVAVVLLSAWMIVSGKGKKVIDALMAEDEDPYADETPITRQLLYDLQPGKYLLERENGLDETDYIEVYEDGTVRFVGEYWENESAEMKALEEESGCYMGPYFSERNRYQMSEFLPSVQLAGTAVGFSYEDADTLNATRSRAESDGVVDHNHEVNEPDVPRYDEMIVIAHYIYTE